jgi:capsular exopolysaccharide synthesis family protein
MDSTRPNTKFDPVRIVTQVFSYVKYFRLMVIVFAIAILAGISYFLYATPLYQAKSLVFFQSYGNPVRNAELPETSVFSAGVNRALLERLQSQQVLIAAGKKLGFFDGESTYENLVERVPKVRVDMVDLRHLEILVEAYEPEVVRAFAPALVEAFQEIQEAGWKEFRDDALERYQLQLTELEKKVAENVDSLTSMERDQNFTEITIEQQNLLEIPKQLVETRERITRMTAIRKTLETYEQDESADHSITILSLLSNFENDSDVTVGNIISRPLVGSRGGVSAAAPRDFQVITPASVESLEPWRDLEREKRTLEGQIEEAAVILLPDHPKMRELVESLEGAKRSLQDEMKVQREKFDLEFTNLSDKLTELTRRIPEYQQVTELVGRTSLEYTSIEQAQLMWDKARERLAEKLAAATFTEDFDSVQLRFKGHTSLRDKVPISPNKRKLVMLSLLLGLAGAIGIPTVLNLLDNSATSLAQLEDYLGLKGLGIVPLTDPDFLEAVHRSPAQGASIPNYLLECFRVIRANIGLDATFDGNPSQVILVVSARPQEGKTTQSANLAWAYHSMGEKVLVVDCDLRRGRQHTLLKLDNSAGMSRMLTGQITPGDAIIHTEQKGFDAIPRGPIIAGSTELLCQEGFFKLVQEWRTHYDRVILDCPPVLGLSESTSLQRLADGIVFVVRSEKTSMKDVRDAVTNLRKTGAHFFGFVLNAVDLSKVGNYYQYYYYSAPYYNQFEEDPAETDGRAGTASRPAASTASAEAKAAVESPPREDPRRLVAAPAVLQNEMPFAPVSGPSRPDRQPLSDAVSGPGSMPRDRPSRAEQPPVHSGAAPKGWSDSEADESWRRSQEERLLQQLDNDWQQPIKRRPTPPTPHG